MTRTAAGQDAVERTNAVTSRRPTFQESPSQQSSLGRLSMAAQQSSTGERPEDDAHMSRATDFPPKEAGWGVCAPAPPRLRLLLLLLLL